MEYKAGENTREIVKDICKHAGREISDADISTSHRNGAVKPNKDLSPGAATGGLEAAHCIEQVLKKLFIFRNLESSYLKNGENHIFLFLLVKKGSISKRLSFFS